MESPRLMWCCAARFLGILEVTLDAGIHSLGATLTQSSDDWGYLITFAVIPARR